MPQESSSRAFPSYQSSDIWALGTGTCIMEVTYNLNPSYWARNHPFSAANINILYTFVTLPSSAKAEARSPFISEGFSRVVTVGISSESDEAGTRGHPQPHRRLKQRRLAQSQPPENERTARSMNDNLYGMCHWDYPKANACSQSVNANIGDEAGLPNTRYRLSHPQVGYAKIVVIATGTQRCEPTKCLIHSRYESSALQLKAGETERKEKGREGDLEDRMRPW
ncbi:hypothetical protein PM082_010178 [Marasmius tenuissimus]|nr:hypothetical protein PM082_010178 [Marasmius tenuissimus]